MNRPPTKTDVEAIRERAEWVWTTRTSGTDSNQAFHDRRALLAKVDRLTAERDALREQVKRERQAGRDEVIDAVTDWSEQHRGWSLKFPKTMEALRSALKPFRAALSRPEESTDE